MINEEVDLLFFQCLEIVEGWCGRKSENSNSTSYHQDLDSSQFKSSHNLLSSSLSSSISSKHDQENGNGGVHVQLSNQNQNHNHHNHNHKNHSNSL